MTIQTWEHLNQHDIDLYVYLIFTSDRDGWVPPVFLNIFERISVPCLIKELCIVCTRAAMISCVIMWCIVTVSLSKERHSLWTPMPNMYHFSYNEYQFIIIRLLFLCSILTGSSQFSHFRTSMGNTYLIPILD